MMVCLLLLIAVLAIHSLTLKGAMKGVRFYLVPNVDNIKDVGIVNVVFVLSLEKEKIIGSNQNIIHLLYRLFI